jgi:hypothetical protein
MRKMRRAQPREGGAGDKSDDVQVQGMRASAKHVVRCDTVSAPRDWLLLLLTFPCKSLPGNGVERLWRAFG